MYEDGPRKRNIAKYVIDWLLVKHKKVFFRKFEPSMFVKHKQCLLRNKRKHIRKKSQTLSFQEGIVKR